MFQEEVGPLLANSEFDTFGDSADDEDSQDGVHLKCIESDSESSFNPDNHDEETKYDIRHRDGSSYSGSEQQQPRDGGNDYDLDDYGTDEENDEWEHDIGYNDEEDFDEWNEMCEDWAETDYTVMKVTDYAREWVTNAKFDGGIL